MCEIYCLERGAVNLWSGVQLSIMACCSSENMMRFACVCSGFHGIYSLSKSIIIDMAKVRVEKPRTFTDYVQLVERLQQDHKAALWYRGTGRAGFELLPSLYRHTTTTGVSGLARLEIQLMTGFRQRSIPLHSRSLADDWDTLFFMQHYGVPTRLLDWTESPFIGLYFAVMSASYTPGLNNQRRFSEDAAVWILDPIAWNQHSLRHQSYDGGILTPGDDSLKGFKPAPSFAGMNTCPVALYGAHNSPRIVAQRGVFTIFGQNTKATERVFDDDQFPSDCLIKLVLKRSRIASFRRSVLNYGVCESVVFPDLEGLAKEIRRNFGFEV